MSGIREIPQELSRVEAVARALCWANGMDPDTTLGGDGVNFLWMEYEHQAKAALKVMGPAQSWLPISAAPRDGTTILIGGWEIYPPEEGDEWANYWIEFLVDWDGYEWNSNGGPKPFPQCSHWSPLPPPPVGSGRSLADANSKSPIQAREE